MRMYLQTLGTDGAPRYCQLMLQQDLLGGWLLIRETGLQGGRSTVRREQYLDLVAAQEAMTAARDQHLRKGYRLVFAQGSEAPEGHARG